MSTQHPVSPSPNGILSGRVALVTGAARGIGRAAALALAEAGADVAVNDVAHLDQLETLAAQITALGRRALICPGDVAAPAQVASAVDRAVATFGRLDIAVANAARSIRKPFIELTWDEAWATFSVTLFGVWHTCQAAARQMVHQGQGGKIVIVGSVQAEVPVANATAYGTSKAGITHLAEILAVELASYHINVNVIHPGWTDTPGERDHYSEADLKEAGLALPWQRLAQPEEIARVIRFMVSDEAEYMTGAAVRVDGGFTLHPPV
ncbi:MAG: SDR family oxidoreductase [Anaerolineae bacterium]